MSISRKLTTIAENQQRVYDAGYAKGQAEGGGGSYDEGYEVGQQAEYDRFWDAFQNNGNRTDYKYGFAGIGWTDETFKPKYDIRPATINRLFAECWIGDLVELLRQKNVTLDTSNANTVDYLAYNCRLTTVPVLDLKKPTSLVYLFYGCDWIHTIEKIILADDGSQTFSGNTFRTPALKNVQFEGVIGKNFTMERCSALTTESVQSVIDHLKDLTGQTAQTITFHATVGGKLTDTQKATIAAKNWTLVY